MPDLLLLHGLTYDHRTWTPLLGELGPRRRTLALDLPGHGAAPRPDSYHPARVAEMVHDRVVEAGLTAPVIVGHSLGAIVATAYAAAFPATAVLNLDQPLRLGPFGAVVRAAEPALRGPDWRRVWDRMVAGMGIETLPDDARTLAETATAPRQDLLLGYWGEILGRSDAAFDADRERELRGIAARGVGYHWVSAREPSPPALRWLRTLVPHAAVTVLPGSHFPHLGQPARIAAMLSG